MPTLHARPELARYVWTDAACSRFTDTAGRCWYEQRGVAVCIGESPGSCADCNKLPELVLDVHRNRELVWWLRCPTFDGHGRASCRCHTGPLESLGTTWNEFA